MTKTLENTFLKLSLIIADKFPEYKYSFDAIFDGIGSASLFNSKGEKLYKIYLWEGKTTVGVYSRLNGNSVDSFEDKGLMEGTFSEGFSDKLRGYIL